MRIKVNIDRGEYKLGIYMYVYMFVHISYVACVAIEFIYRFIWVGVVNLNMGSRH